MTTTNTPSEEHGTIHIEMKFVYEGETITVRYVAEGNDKVFEAFREESQKEGLRLKITLDE